MPFWVTLLSVALGKGPHCQVQWSQHSPKLENGRSENHFSSFAECYDHSTRQRNFFFKKSNFAECQPEGTRQRIFFKKNQTLPSADQGHSAKKFFFKIKNLCRVPAGLELGKATVNGAGTVTVAFLCRVPPGLSAKPLPSVR